ncbi:MAG: lipid-A-disaccharide synthase [Proteobacteria bacterium]|nr:lipid-A-disaccharide synthase [Pseudomonadota bacterium]
MASPLVAIVAGEASGDALGGALIHALRARAPEARFIGMAGPAMLEAGCEALAHIDELSVMGLAEVLRAYPRLRRLRDALGRRLLDARPDVFVGIDVPDFNLGLARRMKRAGIATVHYVCPQAWAWRPGRARHLGASVDRLLALLPFEPAFFAGHGVDCRFVGHPLADALPLAPDRDAARAALGIAAGTPLLALLPGSRGQEIQRLAGVFAAGAAALLERRGPCAVVACAAHAGQVHAMRGAIAAAAPGLAVEILHGRARQLLSAADVALVASGTATLEALLCHAPMVVGYRLAPLSYHIIRRMISIQRIALPNILADEELVPELIQDDLTPAAIAMALACWLDDAPRRERYAARARQLHETLRVGAAQRAADAVLELCAPR